MMDQILPDLDEMLDCCEIESQELQESMHPVNQQAPGPFSQQMLPFNPQQGLDSFSFGINPAQQLNQDPVQLLDGGQYDGSNHFPGAPPLTSGAGKLIDENRESQWQRIRWSEDMVRVLITAVSYVVKALSSCERRPVVPITGKWKAVSLALVERGYQVSPQQCEDKFNDINRKYKRLTDILGSVTSEVVNDPRLLNSVRVSEVLKDEVRKLLSCRQLFYPEMRSYHSCNREHLPPDESLEQSVICALTGQSKSDFESRKLESLAKKQKLQVDKDGGAPDAESSRMNRRGVGGDHEDMNRQMLLRAMELKKKKLQIQEEMVELEKAKMKWLKYCYKQDRKLHGMMIENKLMKLENERILLELRNREINLGRK
ncbi:uncharacterized protein LOC127261338 isoform X2 [Andrographis paniculata]|nr:uncharacterized protein LOC127261338 isoform X2 [Andrographis paniculata]